MKVLLLLTAILLSACNQDSMETTSEIKPLFKAKTIAEKQGGNDELTTVTLKVPLTKDTIGTYDFDEIMEDENLNEENRNTIVADITTALKYKLINIGLNLGVNNRVKTSSYTDKLPEINPEYVKDIRIKRVFFALNQCDEQDEDCQMRNKKRPATLLFIDKLFVNLSVLDPELNDKLPKDSYSYPKIKEFEMAAAHAFNYEQRDHSFSFFRNNQGEIKKEKLRDINIARFKNTKKWRRNKRKGLYTSSMIHFQANPGDTVEIKRLFEREVFKPFVMDTTISGSNIYVELYHNELKNRFFEVIKHEVGDMRRFGVKTFSGCSYLNCVDLEVNSSNLVPVIEGNNYLKFDTYIELKHLEYNDFKYNGYVEIDIKLDLPL